MKKRLMWLVLGFVGVAVWVGCSAPEPEVIEKIVEVTVEVEVTRVVEVEVEVIKEVEVEVEKEVEPFSTGSEDVAGIEAAVPRDKSAEAPVRPIDLTAQDETGDVIVRVEPTAIVAVATTVPTVIVLTQPPEPTAIVAVATVEPTAVVATSDPEPTAIVAVEPTAEPILLASQNQVIEPPVQVAALWDVMARLEAISDFLSQFMRRVPH